MCVVQRIAIRDSDVILMAAILKRHENVTVLLIGLWSDYMYYLGYCHEKSKLVYNPCDDATNFSPTIGPFTNCQ